MSFLSINMKVTYTVVLQYRKEIGLKVLKLQHSRFSLILLWCWKVLHAMMFLILKNTGVLFAEIVRNYCYGQVSNCRQDLLKHINETAKLNGIPYQFKTITGGTNAGEFRPVARE